MQTMRQQVKASIYHLSPASIFILMETNLIMLRLGMISQLLATIVA